MEQRTVLDLGMTASRIGRVDFGIIDVHAHWGAWHFPSECHDRENLYRIMDDAGIEKAVLSSTVAIQMDVAGGNEDLARLIERDRDNRLYGAVVVNPRLAAESLRSLDRFAGHERFVGIKYHPHYSRIPSPAPEAMTLFQAGFEGGLRAYFVHTYSEQQARENLEVAERFPEVSVFLFHMGGNEPRPTAIAAGPYENAILEPCCTPSTRGKLRFAVDTVGEERVVFGSDLTLISPFHTLGMVLEEEFDPRVLRKILRGNALRLLPALSA